MTSRVATLLTDAERSGQGTFEPAPARRISAARSQAKPHECGLSDGGDGCQIAGCSPQADKRRFVGVSASRRGAEPTPHERAHAAAPPRTRRPPTRTGADPTLIDLVAGDPPVPITVWRTARSDDDAGRSIGARLAYRLVAAYSRPGEAVVDLTDGHALTAACRPAGAGTTRPGSPTPPPDHRPGHPAGRRPADAETAATATRPTSDAAGAGAPGSATTSPTPTCRRTGAPVTDLPADGSVARRATSLVVACWPLGRRRRRQPGPAGVAADRLRAAAAPRRLPRPRRRRPRPAPRRPRRTSPRSSPAAAASGWATCSTSSPSPPTPTATRSSTTSPTRNCSPSPRRPAAAVGGRAPARARRPARVQPDRHRTRRQPRDGGDAVADAPLPA